VAYNSRLWKFFPLQTANVAYFQIIIQLSGFSAYPDNSPSQLIQASRVILYLDIYKLLLLTEVNKKNGMDKVYFNRFRKRMLFNLRQWPTWRTNYNTFITILYMYMFRAISCSSSGGQIVLTFKNRASYI